MKIIKKTYIINALAQRVWDALVNSNTIEKWGGGPAKMEPSENFEFELWGGDIFGKNTKVVKNKVLEQDWYGGKWNMPSKLRLELSEENGKTVLKLEQTSVPDEEAKGIDAGWDDYYLGPIKNLLEN